MSENKLSRKVIIKLLSNSNNPLIITIFGLTISLNKHTLVPHSDTFTLIEHARELINSHSITTIADVGTGSGIIALFLAKEFPDKKFYATDISVEALNIASVNAKENDIRNIVFLQNLDYQWLSELGDRQIDLIVSNPPFVGDREFFSDEFTKIYPEINLEPSHAIRTRDLNGTLPYLSIINNAINTNTSYFLFHCNKSNLNNIIQLITQEHPQLLVKPLKDKQKQNRFLLIRKPN